MKLMKDMVDNIGIKEFMSGLDLPEKGSNRGYEPIHTSQRNVPQGGSKKDKRKIRCACPTSGGNTFEVLVSQPSQGYGLAGYGEPNELI